MIGYPVNHVLEHSAAAGIRPIIVRQERTGLHMATAISRVTSGDQIGAFCMQHGPGVENSCGGIAQACSDDEIARTRRFRVDQFFEAQSRHCRARRLDMTGTARRHTLQCAADKPELLAFQRTPDRLDLLDRQRRQAGQRAPGCAFARSRQRSCFKPRNFGKVSGLRGARAGPVATLNAPSHPSRR